MRNVNDSTNFATVTPPVTLRAIVDYIGGRSMRIMAGAANTETPVTGIEFIDASEELPDQPGALMLLVSGSLLPTALLRNVAQEAVEKGYAGIALKVTPERRAEVVSVGENAGITMVEVASHISWRYLEATCAAILGEQNLERMPQHPGFEPLFTTVNTVAEHYRGSAVVEDLSRNVLAYSSVPGQLIDDLRTQGILMRRTPYSPFNDEQYRLVLRADGPVQFAAMGGEEPRVAIAIRAGSVPLGTLWVIDNRANPKDPLNPNDQDVVLDAAESAASFMLDNFRVQEASQKPREAILRRLVSGTDIIGTELFELGFRSLSEVSLTAFSNSQCADSPVALSQLRNTVYRMFASTHEEVVTISVNNTVYALVGSASTSEIEMLCERTIQYADRLVGEHTRAAVTPPVTLASEIESARYRLDQILLAAETQPGSTLLSIERVQPQVLLNRVRDALETSEFELNHALLTLQRSTKSDHRNLIVTLTSWCENLGNVAATANKLQVHENTVRNRIQKIADSLNLQLSDPDVLLTIWLQLRLHRATASPEHEALLGAT